MEAPVVLERSKLKISFKQKPPRLVRWGFHPSPFNPLMIGITPEGVLCRIEFANRRKAAAILRAWQKAWPKTEFVQDKVMTAAILKKLISKGGVAELQMTGTKFQQAVWKTMLTIPVGKVLSYAEVAKRIRRPKAVRAVGTACGANPVPLLVPCHRVVGSNGLGGFGGGLELKRNLLRAEGAFDLAA